MRLQKYLAECGIASRRKSEEIIEEGRVFVNGQRAILGTKIDPETDVISVDNNIINKTEEKVYIMLHKPEGYITTAKDQFDRPTVMDLINANERLYPIGRLDYDTSGLLILTNDGDLTYALTHPKHDITKTYIAKLWGTPTKEELDKFRNGLEIEDYTTKKASIKIIKELDKKCMVEIIIKEGKNRQVRKMCSAIGYEVISLKRVATGNLRLDDLEKGQNRRLTDEEVKYLKTLE